MAPLAAVRPHPIASPHGERIDPYYWLRDDERRDREVLAYLAAENAYKERQLATVKPLEEKLYAEIIARLKQDDCQRPVSEARLLVLHAIRSRQGAPDLCAPQGFAECAGTGHPGRERTGGGTRVLSAGRPRGLARFASGWPSARTRSAGASTGCASRICAAAKYSPTRSTTSRRTSRGPTTTRPCCTSRRIPRLCSGCTSRSTGSGPSTAADALVFTQTDTSFYTGVVKSKSERFIFIYMESTVSSEWRYAEAADPALVVQGLPARTSPITNTRSSIWAIASSSAPIGARSIFA